MTEAEWDDVLNVAERIFAEIEPLCRIFMDCDDQRIAAALRLLADWYAGTPLAIELGEPEWEEAFA